MSDSENNDDDYAVSGSDGDEDPSTTYNPHKTGTQTPKAARGRRGAAAAAKSVPKRSTPKRTMAKRAVKRMRMKPETSDDSDDDYMVSPPPKKKDGRKKGRKAESPPPKSKKTSPAAKVTKGRPAAAAKAAKPKPAAVTKGTKRRKSQTEAKNNDVEDVPADVDNDKKEDEETSPKEKTVIPQGEGIKLGDIEKVDWNIEKFKLDELNILHEILFNKKGLNAEIKSNIKLFNGFDFKKDSPEYEKKKTYLNKLKSASLKICCVIVRIEHSGSKGDLATRLLDYLMKPNDHVKGATPKAKTKKDVAANADKEKTPPSEVDDSPADAAESPAKANDTPAKFSAESLTEKADLEEAKPDSPPVPANPPAKTTVELTETPDKPAETKTPTAEVPAKE